MNDITPAVTGQSQRLASAIIEIYSNPLTPDALIEVMEDIIVECAASTIYDMNRPEVMRSWLPTCFSELANKKKKRVRIR